MSGVTLDAGPLIGLDRGNRRILALIARAQETQQPLFIPATALAQAMRNPARQARLSRLVRQPRSVIVPLDRSTATATGLLLAESDTADIADAHVVATARRLGTGIITSDPDDLRRLDPGIPLTEV
ncbi:PIN domain-containing protein [Ammonicoccus fulvus]|uniref:PIN domain-containing protein n=1 Tax=Ammonicoccus fulvus TaxID=3138240 RepID=A0ABZ3FIY5_9ACTN